jgi:apolipoprotein N-acyltransferase
MSLTADPAASATSVAPPTIAEDCGRSAVPNRRRDLAVAFVASMALAAPWIWQQLVPLEWLAVAAGLLFLPRLGGWWGETLVLLVATTALTTAFHWSPEVLAGSLESSYAVGLAFTIPFIVFDALRLCLPFWFVSRTVGDPRDAWLPAAAVAAASESFMASVFPWKLGYSQLAWPVIVQGVDLFGPEWATFILYAHAGVIVLLAHRLLHRYGPEGRRWTPIGVAAVVVCAANLAYGLWAMHVWSERMAAAPKLRVALLQVDPTNSGAVDELQRLSRDVCASGQDIDLVCWPECSGGSYHDSLESFADEAVIFQRSRDPLRGLRPLAEPACPLLFGGRSYEGYPERPRDIYQSAILIDREERIVGRYHKRHLMPFGEYVPGRDWLPELRHHFPMDADFSVGPDATVLPLSDKARLGVMLCYEDMVPSAAASLVDNSANVLFSLINGSSFKATLTLLQHRLLAQQRSVENRRCLVRCAATGETCVISPLGTITARLPLHEPATLIAEVPLIDRRAPGAGLGPFFPWACASLLALAGIQRLWRRSAAFS